MSLDNASFYFPFVSLFCLYSLGRMGTCIARRNYRFFVMFVFSAAILCLYVFCTCIAHYVLLSQRSSKSGFDAFLEALGHAPQSYPWHFRTFSSSLLGFIDDWSDSSFIFPFSSFFFFVLFTYLDSDWIVVPDQSSFFLTFSFLGFSAAWALEEYNHPHLIFSFDDVFCGRTCNVSYSSYFEWCNHLWRSTYCITCHGIDDALLCFLLNFFPIPFGCMYVCKKTIRLYALM